MLSYAVPGFSLDVWQLAADDREAFLELLIEQKDREAAEAGKPGKNRPRR